MGTRHKVTDLASLPPGKATCVQAAGRAIALFNLGGRLHAVDDACTHAGGNLSEGEVDGTVVTCPWHGATFDLATGAALSAPARENVRCYPVHVQGQDVLLELD